MALIKGPLLLSIIAIFVTRVMCKDQYKVKCTDEAMQVDVFKTDDMESIYLNQLKNYPDEQCQSKIDGNQAKFVLSLKDIHRCGVTRISNKITGAKVFYHQIVIERKGDSSGDKEVLLVKCTQAPPITEHALVKRNILPAGFSEPEDLEVTTTLTGKAPEPMLNVAVRQGSQKVSGELNVNPGTPLTMEIYLDKVSANVYGILVSYMQVTDTKAQEETIIFNGCSVDPYLFENFNTVNGDFLSANFRAFKFPDSTYVQFKGTVNVCLDKCQGVECSNGQTGYGRKRRSVPVRSVDPNKLFEVSLTTFIKINFVDTPMGKLTEEDLRLTNSSLLLTKYRRKMEEETKILNGVEGNMGENFHDFVLHEHQQQRLQSSANRPLSFLFYILLPLLTIAKQLLFLN